MLTGFNEIDAKTGADGGAVTSRDAAVLVMPSFVAVMFVVPAAIPVATPEASIEATAPSELDHVAVDVRVTRSPPTYVPIAWN